jgi:hypothetical protein
MKFQYVCVYSHASPTVQKSRFPHLNAENGPFAIDGPAKE